MVVKKYFQTRLGSIVHDDSIRVMESMKDSSVNLIMTSPPFGLVRKKEYGNIDAPDYVNWFKDFGLHFRRILKDNGSLVIDIGGAWNPGMPTRSLYHFKLLIMLCEELGFNLAQEFYWWNPAKLPTPAEWVTVRRIRVKDAINTIWWLSKTPYPKASNRRVLMPYSASMQSLLKNGYDAKLRPSGHDISDKFSNNNGAAIPPNLIAISNTESNSPYMRLCKENQVKPHPARFPSDLPEYFIRMLTDVGDFVYDPFGGSCVTGEIAERLKRKWLCSEMEEDYLKGAVLRFNETSKAAKRIKSPSFTIHGPSALWNGVDSDEILPEDGGRKRNKK